MNRKLMHARGLTTEYKNGVEKFIKFVVERTDYPNHIRCSCIRCDCIDKVTVDKLKDHLFINRIDKSYTKWIWYGEIARGDRLIISNDGICDVREEVDLSEGDQLEEMINNVE